MHFNFFILGSKNVSPQKLRVIKISSYLWANSLRKFTLCDFSALAIFDIFASLARFSLAYRPAFRTYLYSVDSSFFRLFNDGFVSSITRIFAEKSRSKDEVVETRPIFG